MFQLILVIVLIIVNASITIYSYRRTQSTCGVNDQQYNVWWWLTLLTAISVMCMAISAGVVIQRIYF